jgi:hypothetical protein
LSLGSVFVDDLGSVREADAECVLGAPHDGTGPIERSLRRDEMEVVWDAFYRADLYEGTDV